MVISRTSAQDCPADKDKSWSYNPNFSNGPSHWSELYPNCKGKSQSPINIVIEHVSNQKGHQILKLNGYNIHLYGSRIENNGHTIVLTPIDGIKRSLDLDNVKYNLESLHFHWGNLTTEGSEHKFDNWSTVMEGHFVHRNDKGEIAVVGVRFRVVHKQNLRALDRILSVRDQYLYKDEEYEGYIDQLSLNDFVRNGSKVYRYNGSLTTPPCTENVTWLMTTPSKYIGKSQMEGFFSLYSVKRFTKDIEKCHLINNFRPIQPLNGRKVFS
nr:putative carbonic anhydrase 3 [Parasteatoda tepidariorum]